MYDKIIFELSHDERVGYKYPECDVELLDINKDLDSAFVRQEDPELPQVSEIDVVRHYTALSKKAYGVDCGFYPLGSCTMKYNPKLNEQIARFPGFTNIHPLQSHESVQGTLELIYDLTIKLCEITGMKWGTMQPFAGAHGEYTGMQLFKAYHDKFNKGKRKKLLVPDSAHGTNPASAHIAGFEVVELPSDKNGLVSIDELKPHLNDNLAGIMLTNPNTLGLFEKEINKISSLVHKAGGLLYYDGANLNAIMGKVRPGDMGFDVVHLNLHKTFSTPHGGGGPGAGPILVSDRVKDFLPNPSVKKESDGTFSLGDYNEESIGRISGFYGNIGVLVRAYSYITFMGADGLKHASEIAVLNANYLKEMIKEDYYVPFDGICKHEFVASSSKIKEKYNVSTLDVAKRLLDNKIHPPTIYFPLIVPEALMIEPTETETKETLDNFVSVMKDIRKEAENNPEILHQAPLNTPVKRVDEVLAAKKPITRYIKECE